jgi:long-chain acyl-CoA synthetase
MSDGRKQSGASGGTWRLIYNPEGDPADVVAYGASIAEGRIAGKYQLSNTRVPDTVVVQRSKVPGIVAGADVHVAADAATDAGIAVARAPRQGRSSGKTVGTLALSEITAKASRNFEAAEVDPDDPAVILYTSGTTGNPKGVTLTHRNFHFQCSTIVKSMIPFTHEDRAIGVLPLYHVYGLSNAMVAAVSFGACLVLVGQYSPRNLLKAIDENQATIMPAVPTMYHHLLALARSSKARIPKSLRSCVSGGAPLPLAVLRKFAEVFDTQIIEGYGLTETTSSVCANGRDGVFREGSIGPPAEGVEMAVLDDEGNALADNETGEIAIRSQTVTPGYWNNPEATAEVINDEGWFRTGDLGYRDEDGYYYITDRKKDIIITRGFNISPREVEEVLAEHPKVQEAALVAVPGSRGDEVVTAFIVPVEGEEITEREVVDHCEAELAQYKRPKVVRFVDSLPKSATGKVLRKELRGESEDRRLIDKEAVGAGGGAGPLRVEGAPVEPDETATREDD